MEMEEVMKQNDSYYVPLEDFKYLLITKFEHALCNKIILHKNCCDILQEIYNNEEANIKNYMNIHNESFTLDKENIPEFLYNLSLREDSPFISKDKEYVQEVYSKYSKTQYVKKEREYNDTVFDYHRETGKEIEYIENSMIENMDDEYRNKYRIVNILRNVEDMAMNVRVGADSLREALKDYLSPLSLSFSDNPELDIIDSTKFQDVYALKEGYGIKISFSTNGSRNLAFDSNPDRYALTIESPFYEPNNKGFINLYGPNCEIPYETDWDKFVGNLCERYNELKERLSEDPLVYVALNEADQEDPDCISKTIKGILEEAKYERLQVISAVYRNYDKCFDIDIPTIYDSFRNKLSMYAEYKEIIFSGLDEIELREQERSYSQDQEEEEAEAVDEEEI